jgi:hypothetical protein
MGVILDDLKLCLASEGAVLVAEKEEVIIGLFALFAVDSYLGNQKIAVEKYWYVSDNTCLAGPRLYLAAVNWAREHGCSHLITSGSKMASDRHDSICQFLESSGAKHFETSYIYEL